MHLDICKTGKYKRVLLRETYREGGKVKHRTVANLSHLGDADIEAISFAFKHKKPLRELLKPDPAADAAAADSTPTAEPEPVKRLRQGKSAGDVWVLRGIARELGITEALGPKREGKLAFWQVMARVIDQGSRLSAVRLAGSHAACDILGLGSFTEDSLYPNLAWLSRNQHVIEDKLFAKMWPGAPPQLYLYDVTSSYLEGERNALAAFGYNRDGKKGKRQIVVGLLCDPLGRPLSVEVFKGNTSDPKTVAAQIRKIADRFGGRDVVFVGDRGMVKGKQIEDLHEEGFRYITGITRPQVEKLLADEVFDMSLFDQDLAEVVDDEDGVRYILRCNTERAEDMKKSRKSKFEDVKKTAAKESLYLKEHPKANADKALARVVKKAVKLKVADLATISLAGRSVGVELAEDMLREAEKLDGCYVLKTDVPAGLASKETLHARYKDLSTVEWAFRTSKTGALDMRPIFVRTEASTRGHVFVVMLAYRVMQELAARWQDIDLTVAEGIAELGSLCTVETLVAGVAVSQSFPEPRESVKLLLDAARVELPDRLPVKNITVSTRKKISQRRGLRRKRDPSTLK